MASLGMPSPSPAPGGPDPSSMNNMQGMMSGTAPYGASPQEDQARKQIESGMEQIRRANAIVDALASQFSAASRELDAVKQALVKAAVRIVGSQPQADSQPPTGVMG
jgi:hypothetical protein